MFFYFLIIDGCIRKGLWGKYINIQEKGFSRFHYSRCNRRIILNTNPFFHYYKYTRITFQSKIIFKLLNIHFDKFKFEWVGLGVHLSQFSKFCLLFCKMFYLFSFTSFFTFINFSCIDNILIVFKLRSISGMKAELCNHE